MLTKIKNLLCGHKSRLTRWSQGFIDYSGVRFDGVFRTIHCEGCGKVLGEPKFVRSRE